MQFFDCVIDVWQNHWLKKLEVSSEPRDDQQVSAALIFFFAHIIARQQENKAKDPGVGAGHLRVRAS